METSLIMIGQYNTRWHLVQTEVVSVIKGEDSTRSEAAGTDLVMPLFLHQL
jgi:hypothetical protein